MRRPSHRRLLGGIGALVGGFGLCAAGFTSSTAATRVTQTGPVSVTPASGTPQLVPTSGNTTENVRQLVQCGGMMYAVGQFTTITQGGSTYTRNNIFSFSATAPYAVSGLNVDVNGQVSSIAFNQQNGCADAYIGGTFTTVHGTAARNIAEISTSTGAVVTGFRHDASREVDTLVSYAGHLLVGGGFLQINGSARQYYASLSPSTGKDDGFLNLNISGNVPSDPTKVYNQQLSHGGNLLLVEGDFTSVGGQPRQQIFMLNLSGSTAQLTGWTSPEFSQHCVARESFYIKAAAWSPDDSTIYTASTGFHPLNWVSGSYPLTGLCDAAAAFPASQQSVGHLWINYTGCDSLYSVAADDSAVYVGGHERWSQNASGCNFKGPGARIGPGLQGLEPSSGLLEPTSGGPGMYSMSKNNADDMLLTSAGLWIASSNRFNSQMCGGVSGHTGICFLPYS